MYRGSSKVGVVLVHEIFGFDEYIESVADRLSQDQFWTAAVDLYQGKHASNLEEGFKIRSSLKDTEVLEALQSGILLLAERIGGDAKIGSMGFCMGGGFALLGACNLNLSFCVDYYGLIEDTEQIKGLKGPVQIILASEDEWVTRGLTRNFFPQRPSIRNGSTCTCTPRRNMVSIDPTGKATTHEQPPTLGQRLQIFFPSSSKGELQPKA